MNYVLFIVWLATGDITAVHGWKDLESCLRAQQVLYISLDVRFPRRDVVAMHCVGQDKALP